MADEQPDDVTNPSPDGGEAGTQGDGARNAETEADRENQGKLLQALQEKAARVNAAEAETDRLRAERDLLLRSQSPAARPADPEAERRNVVKRIAEGTYAPDLGPDYVAQQLLATEQKLEMALYEIANMRSLDMIEDKATRKEVLDHFNANRHRLADVEGARNEIENKKRLALLEQKDEENAKLRKALEATSRRQNPDVVRTDTREVPAAEHKAREMTQAEWDAEVAQLGPYDRMQRQKEMLAGRIVVKQ